MALDRLQPGRGRILDIGCGFGLFLDQARTAGWDPFGIDVSEVSVAHARWQLTLSNVEQSDLERSQFPNEFFQAVTMWNVLEHVPDPAGTLARVRAILAEDGVILVRVPNMLVHHALWLIRPVLRPVLQVFRRKHPPYLGGISPPHHLYGFTPATVKAMLKHAGFHDVEIEPAVPHGARSFLGRIAAAVGRLGYAASGRRLVISPAIVAYARGATPA